MMLRDWDGLECDGEDGKGEKIGEVGEGVARYGSGSGEKWTLDQGGKRLV